MKRIKLADPSGTFTDPQTGQRVSRSQIVDLIEPVGKLTQDWLNHGGLVFVKTEEKRPPAPKPSSPAEVRSTEPADSILLDANTAPPPPPPEEPKPQETHKKRDLSGMKKRPSGKK